ncbi:hypothetical protein [Natronomonas marina]|jgi:hypothetical protein|uniref:hypothetical protein n=1 Tax=Natronomonas marina TaxID=2961939 RepID=UPI0020C9FAC7|nr:hypothetical protein [Natronomonas marina]
METRTAVVALLTLLVGVGLAATPVAAQSAEDPLGDNDIELGGDDVPGEITFETDDGSTLVVDGVIAGGHARVDCVDSDSQASYCDKGGELYLGPGSLTYEGYNAFEDRNDGGFGDSFSVMQDGEEVATIDVETQDNPIAVIVGFLGGLGFGIFG